MSSMLDNATFETAYVRELRPGDFVHWDDIRCFFVISVEKKETTSTGIQYYSVTYLTRAESVKTMMVSHAVTCGRLV